MPGPITTTIIDRIAILGAIKRSLQIVSSGDAVPIRSIFDLIISGDLTLNIPVNELATARLITEQFGAPIPPRIPGPQKADIVINQVGPQGIATLNSTTTTQLAQAAVWEAKAALGLLELEPALSGEATTGGVFEANSVRSSDIPHQKTYPTIVFLNETGEEWFEFVIFQIDTAQTPTGIAEYGIFNMIPTVDLQGGETKRDWNTIKRAEVKLLPNRIVRLFGILSADHSISPHRTVINIDPFTVPDELVDKIFYRVTVTNDFSTFKVCRINH